ncbi:MAG: alpha/beta hydrolase [Myxococcales bacterium]|nr:alpha/beta hydrolase [Myxococcales bacterium]
MVDHVNRVREINAYDVPGLHIIEQEIQVPLDHRKPDHETISVFARTLKSIQAKDEQRPFILYLQGGPGFECQRPTRRGGWMDRALDEFHVILIDQRGTGRSSPVCHRTLLAQGDASQQAQYLTHFRADSIVADCEVIRKAIIGEDTKWSILGQSFGGFCALTYLSYAPDGLESALFTGGLPPLDGHPDKVYQATYDRVLERDRRYFERYPDDRKLIERITKVIEDNPVELPSGTRLSRRLLQHLGIGLGRHDGSESLHYLLNQALVSGPNGPELAYRFLWALDSQISFNTNPIYAILHEAIYCQMNASRWSAERIKSQRPEYQSDEFVFTGEMVYPWMFEDMNQLKPLANVAQILADKTDWPSLYSPDVLAQNKVPCAALVYDEDMYVERAFSSQTAQSVRGMRVWVTNQYEHNGLRQAGPSILSRLLDLARGEE